MNVFSFMQWNKIIFSFGERWNVPFNSNSSSFTSWKYLYHCAHKHSLFVYYFLATSSPESQSCVMCNKPNTTWLCESILRSSVPKVMTWGRLTFTDDRCRVIWKFKGMENIFYWDQNWKVYKALNHIYTNTIELILRVVLWSGYAISLIWGEKQCVSDMFDINVLYCK